MGAAFMLDLLANIINLLRMLRSYALMFKR